MLGAAASACRHCRDRCAPRVLRNDWIRLGRGWADGNPPLLDGGRMRVGAGLLVTLQDECRLLAAPRGADTVAASAADTTGDAGRV